MVRDGRGNTAFTEKQNKTKKFTETNNKKTSLQTRQILILTGKKADLKETKNTKSEFFIDHICLHLLPEEKVSCS